MNPFRAGQPVSARVLNAMKSAADVIRRLRAGRGMSIRQAGDGAIFECTLPFKPRIFARVTRITAGSGSGSGSSGSGTPGSSGASGEEAPAEPPATPAGPGDDVPAGSGSGASGSGSGEACPAGSKPAYSFVEVAPTCGGQWETRENGATGDGGSNNPAYTMNDGTVADGTIVEIVPGALWWNGVRFVQEWVIVSVSGTGTRRRIELVTNVCLVQGDGSGASGASGSPE